MKLSSICYLLLAVFGLVQSPESFGHEVDTCLMQVEQAAMKLQSCHVRQALEHECDATEHLYKTYSERCRSLYFTDEAIQHAAQYGAGQVEGDPAFSPYVQARQRAAWEQTQMRPNIERFASQFPQFDHFESMLLEHFGTKDCPTGYLGYPDRWQFMGMQQFIRYPLDSGEENQEEQKDLYFFAREQAGQCLAIPLNPTVNEPQIINLPERLLDGLGAQAVRCEGADCTDDRSVLISRYQQYQGAYREYRQLMVCADAAARNARRGSIKGMSRSLQALPDYCPDQEVDTAYLNARGRIEEWDRQLFGPRLQPGQMVNMSPD